MSGGLYIHIPFCAAKCPYCDFVSFAGRTGQDMDAYVRALENEMALWKDEAVSTDTVFFGGGTPTLLGADRLVRLLEAAVEHFHLLPDAEITLEANPNTISGPMLQKLYRGGFNRISFGAQSFSGALLSTLGRIHGPDEIKEGVLSAADAGFENISLDLMFGLPGQHLKDVEYDMEEALRLPLRHLSYYSLKVEEETPFYRWQREGKLALADEDLERDMAALIHDRLTAAGFDHYEISNFAVPGRASRHNLHYWRNEPYVGLGCAAHGRWKNLRYAHAADLDGYMKGVAERKRMPVTQEAIDPRDDAFETLMMGLRLAEGIDIRQIEKRTGLEVAGSWIPIAERHAQRGFVTLEGCRIRPTLKGWDVQNSWLVDYL
ncbi:MAG: radical SAM family heme chaperone HemW [Christensenellales bacterium]|jgi:oxygen-independent coproporphyrinogen-3 oxidase